MQENENLSRQVAHEIGAELSQCYWNAYRAVQECAVLAGGQYVEGYAVNCSRLLIKHGWIELDG